MRPDTDTPLGGTWDQAVRQEVTSYIDPPVDRQTPVKTLPRPKLRLLAVKITFPQTIYMRAVIKLPGFLCSKPQSIRTHLPLRKLFLDMPTRFFECITQRKQ